MTLAEFSVRKPITTLMVFFAAILVGGVCLWQLPIDLMPEMDLPAISVITMYQGAGPADVETKVTDILERYLSTVPELKHVVSKSKEGLSAITLSFEWDTDLDTRANEVRDAVSQAKIFLPDEVDEPRVFKFNIASMPIMVYGIMAQASYPDLQETLDDEVVSPLKRLPGVGSAAAMVPLQRQVNVNLDREKLAAHGLTPQDVAMAIAAQNVDTPAGNLKSGITDYLLRVPGEIKEVDQLNSIVLVARDNSIVRLSDVGAVEDGFREMQMHVTINRLPGAVLLVQKQSGANTVEVARGVRKRIRELQQGLPPDIKFINVMDSSEDIEMIIRDLSNTLWFGAVLVMVVVFLFLWRWRASLVIGLTMPFSLFAAIIVLYFLHYTINMITLSAMIIAVGMIVDNAIVILENVTRHRELGERPDEAAIYGSNEVSMAVVASTITTVCIFFPILFVKGITKILFTPFAVIVCVVLMASLFSAITLTPMLAATLMKRDRFGEPNERGLVARSERAFRKMLAGYSGILDWALNHRALVVVTAVVLFASSLLLVPKLGTEFIPEEDRGSIEGTIQLPVGTRVEETTRVMEQIDRIMIEAIPGDERVATFIRCGTTPYGVASVFGEEGANIGLFGVKLVPSTRRSRSASDIADDLRRRIEKVKGPLLISKYSISSGDHMAAMMTGGELPITIDIIGDDMDLADEVAARIKKAVMAVPNTVDVSVSREKGKPELWLNVDREKASSLGMSVAGIGSVVRSSFYGQEAGKFRTRGKEYDIFVRPLANARDDVIDMLAVPLRSPLGVLMRSDNIASVSYEYGPIEIDRKDQGRIVKVTGNVYGRSIGKVTKDIERELLKMDIPPGIHVETAGQAVEQRESFFWLGISLIVGTLLVYMVMASQFESLRGPFIIMFSVPFAFTGTIWSIFFAGHNISVVVLIGLLMLVGIVVNNAIVLVDFINILRARGLPMRRAICDGGAARLRPVLMTTLTTIVALIPMAFGKGQGAEVWNPLGLTVMGGLTVSTIITLVFVPVMYSLFEARSEKRKNMQNGVAA